MEDSYKGKHSGPIQAVDGWVSHSVARKTWQPLTTRPVCRGNGEVMERLSPLATKTTISPLAQ